MLEYLFGLVSMLADFVYEGGRSAIPAEIRDPVELGIISGTSEGLGYLLRALSGVMADKLGAHYLFMFLGYSLVVAYPIAALIPSLTTFLVAVVVERIGKAIRSPARDALVAANVEDPGKAFAIIEVMDQAGAVAGPLTLFLLSSYFGLRESMVVFFIPYIIMILILLKLRNLKVVPRKKEVVWSAGSAVAFSFLIGASFVQPILSVASAPQPVLGYALVMLVDALASVLMGKFFRKLVYLAPLLALSSLSLKDWRFLPLAGVAIAYTEVVVRAVIAEAGGEGRLYGLAYAALGLGYFVGGLVMPSLSEAELAVYSLALSGAALAFLPKRGERLIPKL
ncbi:major facilitator superfamily MFS_1 [Ignicoccus hospitalis KIN4/I]|uniref:Major facilitator superfamily MFS_1 n=1 Tax=Ignicoccus hospitalis (strain KIN4/I / DSM 18386 / JCM 14125) TaxID=453591 RepID=A8AAN0_IGNH4|nr:major facilitator superfamily MFS_1 [Ignicoccus hospitalis KIN4/I]